MDKFTASEWRYRAEGNKHIVVCNGKGRVLRLQKKWADNQAENGVTNKLNCYEETKDEVSNTKDFPELEFISHIALPLLKGCLACHLPIQVELSEVFFRELHDIIEKDRPEFREHKVLDPLKPSLLMQDHCYIPHSPIYKCCVAGGLVLSPDIISVEIKLKKGFISEGDISPDPLSKEKLCNFCSTQLYRRYCKNRYKSCSYYCPLDLFSGCPTRIKNALFSMIQTPQNNIRVFKNGDVIHSQEIMESNDDMQLYDTNSKQTNLFELLYHFFRNSKFKEVNSYVDVGLVLTDIVTQTLLLKITDIKNPKPVSRKNQANCSGAKYKAKLSANICQQYTEKCKNNCFPNTQTLKQGCILDLILSAQKVWTTNMIDIEKAHLTIEQSINCDNKIDVGLDSPFDTDSWKKITDFKIQEPKFKNRTEQAINLLQRFLISKSFSDCSVMVSIQPIVNSTLAENLVREILSKKISSPLCHIVKDIHGNLSLVYIAVVDTDPKPSTKIPEYIELNKEIKDWFVTMKSKILD